MSGANRIKGKGRLTPAKTLRFKFDNRILTLWKAIRWLRHCWPTAST
jgi:hypothetical protein